MRNLFSLLLPFLTLYLVDAANEKEDDFRLMLNQLKVTNPFLHVMDLSAFKDIDSNGRSLLIDTLSQKRFAGSVKWHPEFDSIDFKEKVEKLLMENYNNYSKSRNDHHSNVCYDCDENERSEHIKSHLPEFNLGVYVERVEYIQKLSSLMNFEQIAWIQAESGMGKSTLALKYAHETAATRITRWMDSESLFKILFNLRDMVREIGCQDPYMIIDDMTDAISEYIGRHQSIDYLFIFDNIVDLDEEKVIMLNKLRVNKNLKILLTTRKDLSLYKVAYLSNNNRLTLEYFKIEEQISYGRMFIEKYFGEKLDDTEIKEMTSSDECMKSKLTPYQLNLVRINLIETPIKEYFRIICNPSSDLITAYPLLSYLKKNNHLKDEWNLLQYSAFLDSDFINIDILEDVLNKTKPELNVAVKSLERLGLISLHRKYNTDGIKIFHKNFQEEVVKFVEEFFGNKKELVFNLAKSINRLIPSVVETDGYFSLLEYAVHFRFKKLESVYSKYLNPEYFEKSRLLKANITICESYVFNYNKIFASLSDMLPHLTVPDLIYIDVNVFITKFRQIFCYHLEGMDTHNFALMKLVKHFIDYKNSFLLLDYIRFTALGDGLWYFSCPHQLTWKTASFFSFGFI